MPDHRVAQLRGLELDSIYRTDDSAARVLDLERVDRAVRKNTVSQLN
jgi:hypothetical protein